MAAIYLDDEGNNELHEIIRRSNSESDFEVENDLVTYFSEKTEAEVKSTINGQNRYGNTPLLELVSCMEPSVQLLKKLIQFGCDINIADNLQMNAVYKIIAKQFVPGRILQGQYLGEMEKYLIQQQSHHDKLILNLLLKAGIDVNKSDIFGRTPLFLANDIEVIRSLIDAGADSNIQDKCGRTLFLSAFSMPNFEYLQRFYASKMNPILLHRPDKYGSTPLHYAAIFGKKDGFNELVQNGANAHAKDLDGYSPLEILQDRYPIETVIYDKQMRNSPKQVELKKAEIVHYNDIMEREDLSDIILKPKNLSQIYSFLNQPGLGGAWNEKESVAIIDAVNDFAQHLCFSIGKLDKKLKCTLFQSGSTAEGTKIGDPTEFDFVFCLDEISNLCNVIEVPYKKGFAEFHFNQPLPSEFEMFFDRNKKCDVTKIRCIFAKLLRRIVMDSNTWTNEHLYFDGDVHHLEEYDRPVFTLKLRWIGCMYKDEEISIDIVPAVCKEGWWPSVTNFNNLDIVTEEIWSKGCLLLLQNPYFQSNTLLRISCSPAEILLIKTLPEHARQSYRLVKLLRHKSICPLVDPNPSEDEFPLFEANDCITSYMLKNCFFNILGDCNKEQLLCGVNKSDENNATVLIAIKLLKYLERCLVSETLPVYFLPNREDIFRFDFVEIDKVDDSSVKKLVLFHCTRRQAFLKIMLYVLGQRLELTSQSLRK